MNKKKILMIIVLIAFIAIIGILVTNVNSKSEEKLKEVSSTENSTNNLLNNNIAKSIVTSENNSIRKSVQGVSDNKNNSTVEITDNFFIQQTNDIYLNLKDYLGKTIKMEGLIYNYEDSNGDICYAVVRNTPGCCGSDGLAGLDIRYDGKYPKVNTWVEVVGTLGKDTVFGDEIPAIKVTSLTEKEVGTTFVTN